MKQLLKIFIVLGIVSDLRAQAIADYLNQAAATNPSLNAYYATFEASMKRVSQVNALPDPTLSFGYFISPIETRVGAQQAKISLSQMFPWFGTLKAKEQVATLQAEGNYQIFLDQKNDLFFKVKQGYYPLYQVKEHLRLQKENIQILETYKEVATTNFANGKGVMTDVLRVGIMIENVKMDIQLLEDQIRPLEISFNRLLNRDDSLKVVVADTLLIETKSAIQSKNNIALTNPKIKALEKKLLSLEAQEKVAQKSGLPLLGVSLDYAFISKRTDMNVPDNGRNVLMPMVTMSIPIFRKKYNAAIEEKQLLQQSVKHQIKATENTLVSSYENALYEAQKAIQLNTLYTIQLQKTEQVLNLLYTGYSNSGKDFEEVLRMQQQLLKYEIAQATAKTKYQIALAQLAYITAKSE